MSKKISSVLILGLLLSVGRAVPVAKEVPEVLVYRNESVPWCGTFKGEDAGITVEILREISKQGGPPFPDSAWGVAALGSSFHYARTRCPHKPLPPAPSLKKLSTMVSVLQGAFLGEKSGNSVPLRGQYAGPLNVRFCTKKKQQQSAVASS